jgi:hypothetical protein
VSFERTADVSCRDAHLHAVPEADATVVRLAAISRIVSPLSSSAKILVAVDDERRDPKTRSARLAPEATQL